MKSYLSACQSKCIFTGIYIYFFISAQLELFCDFLQSDCLHKRPAFYDILAHRHRLMINIVGLIPCNNTSPVYILMLGTLSECSVL